MYLLVSLVRFDILVSNNHINRAWNCLTEKLSILLDERIFLWVLFNLPKVLLIWHIDIIKLDDFIFSFVYWKQFQIELRGRQYSNNLININLILGWNSLHFLFILWLDYKWINNGQIDASRANMLIALLEYLYLQGSISRFDWLKHKVITLHPALVLKMTVAVSLHEGEGRAR